MLEEKNLINIHLLPRCLHHVYIEENQNKIRRVSRPAGPDKKVEPDYKLLPTRNLRLLRNPFPKSGTVTSEPSFATRSDDTITLKSSEILQKLGYRNRAHLI